MCDNLLQISMPETPLTDILKDFRQYRPGNHRQFLEAVRDCAQECGTREFAKQDSVSAALYLQALDQVRDFRWRHWCFTREYILKHTAHPTATGGSPIVTVSSSTFEPGIMLIICSGYQTSWVLSLHRWRRRPSSACQSMVSVILWRTRIYSAKHLRRKWRSTAVSVASQQHREPETAGLFVNHQRQRSGQMLDRSSFAAENMGYMPVNSVPCTS